MKNRKAESGKRKATQDRVSQNAPEPRRTRRDQPPTPVSAKPGIVAPARTADFRGGAQKLPRQPKRHSAVKPVGKRLTIEGEGNHSLAITAPVRDDGAPNPRMTKLVGEAREVLRKPLCDFAHQAELERHRQTYYLTLAVWAEQFAAGDAARAVCERTVVCKAAERLLESARVWSLDSIHQQIASLRAFAVAAHGSGVSSDSPSREPAGAEPPITESRP